MPSIKERVVDRVRRLYVDLDDRDPLEDADADAEDPG